MELYCLVVIAIVGGYVAYRTLEANKDIPKCGCSRGAHGVGVWQCEKHYREGRRRAR